MDNTRNLTQVEQAGDKVLGMIAPASASSILSSVGNGSITDHQSSLGSDAMSRDPSLTNTIIGQKICPNCGKEVSEPEIKLIPTQRAWFCFTLMFFCLLWWVSWIPFLIDKCKFKKPVQMCPHCYRRLDRPPV